MRRGLFWLVLLFALGVVIHGLTVLILRTAYLGPLPANVGVAWFAVGFVLASLLMVPQAAMYVRNSRRCGRRTELLKYFFTKWAFVLVLWPLLTATVCWDYLQSLRESDSVSSDDLDEAFDDEDES